MRFLLAFWCVIMLAATALPATVVRAGVVVEPAGIDESVGLGQVVHTSITVAAGGTDPQSLRVYEAEAAPAQARSAPSGQTRAQLPKQASRLDPALQTAFRSAATRSEPFIIYLRDQADLSAAYQMNDWRARGEYVYRTLSEHAARSQAGLLDALAARGLKTRSLWIVNAVIANGSLADAKAVLDRAEVAFVRANHVSALPINSASTDNGQNATTTPCNPSNVEATACWNVRAIRADAVWRDFGVTGGGVVVANVDTGVAVDHPALLANYRGNLNGTLDHNYNWFDPNGLSDVPEDDYGHGTHTMGSMVGVPVDGENGVGVAPGARWIAARGCADLYCNDFDLIASAQWLLAPTRIDGTTARPDLRPMIISNSWSGSGNDPWYAPYTAAWRAAGMFPVFAAGNATGTAQTCGSIGSPADYADVVAVGSVGSDDTISNFSLIGPSRDGRVKPDFVAPGGAIYSTYPPQFGLYHTLSGTSMATPQVAATVALLWSANPALIGDYDRTYHLLRDSAKKLDDARCGDMPGAANAVYGNGRIDAYAAVEHARVDVPWLSVVLRAGGPQDNGQLLFDVTLDATAAPKPAIYQARIQLFDNDLTQPLATIPVTMRVAAAANQLVISGQVVNDETGQPLQASVALARGQTVGSAVATAADGRFDLTLVDTSGAELVVSAPSFLARRQALYALGEPAQVRLQPDLPRLVLPAAPIDVSLPFAGQTRVALPIENRGTQPLFYRVSIPTDPYTIQRSDRPNGPAYSWIDLPPTAQVLGPGDTIAQEHIPLGMAFPFYNATLTQTVVTSDGMMLFGKPASYRNPATSCMPDKQTGVDVIAPLRLDLDPGQGGRVRYGTLGDTFVLSYENVPLRQGNPDQVYSFQLVLHQNGRIVFQYKQLGPLPNRASVGVLHAPNDVFAVGCGTTTPVHAGLAIELIPQSSSASWLKTTVRSGTLQPNERADIPLQVNWLRPSPFADTYEARVLITSNDPRQNPAVQRVLLHPRPAPYEIWLNPGAWRR